MFSLNASDRDHLLNHKQYRKKRGEGGGCVCHGAVKEGGGGQGIESID